MKAIILAGGMGTRLREVIEDIPKPMASVGGKPFLEYLILQLKRWEITDVMLSIGYKKDVIKSYFGNGYRFGIHISYSEESQPLGTGGALKKAISLSESPYFIVMNGDSFFNINFPDFIMYHKTQPGMTIMSLAFVEDRGRYGGVEVSESGRIMHFKERGADTLTPGLINGGIYLVNRDITNYIQEGAISLEGQIFPLLKKDNLLYGKAFNAFFLDMGIPDDYFWICKHPEKLEENITVRL